MLPIQEHPICFFKTICQVYVPAEMTQVLALWIELKLQPCTVIVTGSSTYGTEIQKQRKSTMCYLNFPNHSFLQIIAQNKHGWYKVKAHQCSLCNNIQ